MRRLSLVAAVIMVGLISGCRSAFVEATVVNHSVEPISLIQVDYPSASFGTQAIAPGASFHYRFKVIGSGAVRLAYTDGTHKEQHSDGPVLHEADDGTLTATVNDGGVQWDMARRGGR